MTRRIERAKCPRMIGSKSMTWFGFQVFAWTNRCTGTVTRSVATAHDDEDEGPWGACNECGADDWTTEEQEQMESTSTVETGE